MHTRGQVLHGGLSLHSEPGVCPELGPAGSLLEWVGS